MSNAKYIECAKCIYYVIREMNGAKERIHFYLMFSLFAFLIFTIFALFISNVYWILHAINYRLHVDLSKFLALIHCLCTHMHVRARALIRKFQYDS